MQGGPLSDDEYARATRLRERLRRFQRRSEELVRQHGLTPQRYLMLLLVKHRSRRGDGATIGELARRTQLGEATVEESARRAAADGLVSLRPQAGGQLVALTESGERRLADATAALLPLHDELLHDLCDELVPGR